MRISELSRESGVSIPTIKFYLREGLLPPGTPTASNQAQYGDGHVHRLRLVRVLMDVGGLGVAAVRKVLDAIADEALPTHEMLGTVQFALGPVPDAGPVPDDVARARAEVDRFLAERGWRVSPENPSRRTLADALAALWRLGWQQGAEVFTPYAELAERLAAFEVGTVPDERSRAEAVESVVVGTVVFEAALVALRRLAQAHRSAERFAAGGKRRAPRR